MTQDFKRKCSLTALCSLQSVLPAGFQKLESVASHKSHHHFQLCILQVNVALVKTVRSKFCFVNQFMTGKKLSSC